MLCLTADMMSAARINRVVLSGGEPLLHAGISRVLQHYANVGIPERVIITNGLLASRGRLVSCLNAGATGVVFSIDSSDEAIAQRLRGMTPAQTRQVFAHLVEAGELTRAARAELGVNAVLSAGNCNVETLDRLAADCARVGASRLKFQPVFDDGYLGAVAPELRLGQEHAAAIRAIGRAAKAWSVETNPAAFFESLAAVCEGRLLAGPSCGLGGRSFLLQAGRLVVCPWIRSIGARDATGIADAVDEFRLATSTCATGMHCFCLQPMDQRWNLRNAVS
jgi:MoaA/NifB/PqqE/SkfB family radical SAM enzyme